MMENAYAAVADETADMTWATWLQETQRDDDRRYQALKDICAGKSILEFGCGNGGFLRRMQSAASSVTGIELMDEAREKLGCEGIEIYKTLDGVKKTYDIVCMFNVIEHLNEPDIILQQIYRVLDNNGVFICETVNADCALISKYECAAYGDFTYWSEHVTLFDSNTLEKLIARNGFRTLKNLQVERYPLSNHLYWLVNGKPGGHVKWTEFNDEKLNKAYEKILAELEIADTLWYIGEKNII